MMHVMLLAMGILLNSLQEVGSWIQCNLSVEGLIALPALMASFLIALAIYNFEDSKKGLFIDAPTIMTQAVRVPNVIWSFVLVSSIVILFEVKADLVFILPLLAVTYFMGLLLLVQSIQRSYWWARSLESNDSKNIRTIMRTKYLSSLSDNEKVSAWEKIWHTDSQTRALLHQRDLIRLFISSTQQIKPKNTIASALVRDLTSVIDSIDLSDPIIMEYLMTFCLSEARGLAFRPTKVTSASEEIYFTTAVRQLFIAILNKSLSKDDISLYCLIDSSRKYLEEHSVDEEQFITVLATNLLEYIKDKDDKTWIWDYIPSEWKVTAQNLENPKTKKASFAWLNSYARMLNSMPLYTELGELNMPLQTITSELLPKADPMLWAKLFSFHWSPHGVNKGESSEHAQVRNYIENHLSFGFMSHVHTQYMDHNRKNDAIIKETEKEEQEVIDIAVKTTIFGFFHDDTIMKKYFAAIRKLKKHYIGDTDVVSKLDELELILRKIQKQIRIRRGKK